MQTIEEAKAAAPVAVTSAVAQTREARLAKAVTENSTR